MNNRKFILTLTIDCCCYNITNEGITFDFYKEIINPVYKYIELANKYNIKLSFMWEIFSYTRLSEYKDFEKIISDMDNMLIYAHNSGHDIQIHPHNAWIYAKYKDNKWYRGGNFEDDIVENDVIVNDPAIFDDYFILFDKAIHRLKTLLVDWEPLVYRAIGQNGWDGRFNLDEKNKEIFFNKLKERNIISTTNHYIDDAKYPDLNKYQYCNINELIEIPMYRHNNKYGMLDYFGIPENKDYLVDCSYWKHSGSKHFVVNYHGHSKNCYVFDKDTNCFKEREKDWNSIEQFFDRIDKNEDFITSTISKMALKLKEHDLDSIVVPTKEYQFIWDSGSNDILTGDNNSSFYMEIYKKNYQKCYDEKLKQYCCNGNRLNIYTKYNNFLLNNIPKECKTVIDMCCGTGSLTKLLKEKGYMIEGVDFEENAVKIAQMRNPNINYHVGDIRNWKPDNKVDCVLIIDCLSEFTSDAVEMIIRHIKTYIKQNGYLIITYTLSNRYISPSKESAIHKRVLTFKDELMSNMPIDTYLEWSSVDWENQEDMNKGIVILKNI